MCETFYPALIASILTLIVIVGLFLFLYYLYVKKHGAVLAHANAELKAIQIHNIDLLKMLAELKDHHTRQHFRINKCRKDLDTVKEILYQRQGDLRNRKEYIGRPSTKLLKSISSRKSSAQGSSSGILPSHCYLVPEEKPLPEDVYV